ncbi:MAG: phosphoribosylformylglycinamidine synthase subunit PurS [Myxococcota bacterium]
MFKVELIVRPRAGVRDPQGNAVEESLRSIGFDGMNVHCVGRYLRMDLDAESEEAAKKIAEEMCRRLLVNPSLETYDLTIAAI